MVTGDQTAWVLSDVQFNPSLPVPLTRIAMQNMCEAKMRVIAHQLLELNAKWNKFVKQNHYDRPHLFTKESYVNSAPLSQRALKLKMVREAASTWRIRFNRDSMIYEDDQSYLVGKFLDAQERRRDYDRYFVLATRYGHYSEEEFYIDSTPGFRYWKKVIIATVKFQRLWDRYWSSTKIRRFRGARLLQTLWRKYSAFKQWNPIIKIRIKIGKRSYYRFCWNLWMEYNQLCRRIKDAIHFAMSSWKSPCFMSWKKLTIDEKNRKRGVMMRFAARIKNSGLVMTFVRWKTYTKDRIQTKLYMRRMLGMPLWERWVNYTQWSKREKKLYRAASVIAAMTKRFFAIRKYLKQRESLFKLKGFFCIVAGKMIAKHRRNILKTMEFETWLPLEMERRTLKSNEKERLRVLKINNEVKKVEMNVVLELKHHLQTSSGSIQIREIVDEIFSRPKNANMRTSAARKMAEKELIQKCIDANSSIERHDHDSKQPPPYKCAHFKCAKIFTTEAQYHLHKCSAIDDVDQRQLFSQFHIMVKSGKGRECVERFLTSKLGFGGVVNCLDFWMAIQEWRRIPKSNVNYLKKIFYIYEMFLKTKCPRPLEIVDENGADYLYSYQGQKLLRRIENVKTREFEGFYQRARLNPGTVRRVLGIDGRKYDCWTDDYVFVPDIINELEWLSFHTIFHAFEQHELEFKESTWGLDYARFAAAEASTKRAKLLDDYSAARLDGFKKWASSFKQVESEMFNKAEEVVCETIVSESDHLFEDLTEIVIVEMVFDQMYKEQIVHESVAMKVDETLTWVEENLFEEIYAFFVPKMLDAQLEVPEMRKGMLEYAGLIKLEMKRKMAIVLDRKSENKTWFEKWFATALEAEAAVQPLSHNEAVIRIQKTIRGFIDLKKVRMKFVNVYVKRFDSTVGACYYLNVVSNETSWERPSLYPRLFPKGSW